MHYVLVIIEFRVRVLLLTIIVSLVAHYSRMSVVVEAHRKSICASHLYRLSRFLSASDLTILY